MKPQLVLSLFPGVGLLDRAFEETGFVVVRGPDLLWGGDIRTFTPPAGRFDGVIGGPPCQAFSRLRHVVRQNGHHQAENLIPEFARCIAAARPHWFLMENVPEAPLPAVAGYELREAVLNNRDFGSIQNRRRRIAFGVRAASSVNLWRWLEIEALQPAEWERAVCAAEGKSGKARQRHPHAIGASWKVRRPFERACELQGLPAGFLADAPFTVHGKYRAVGNAVPLPMGRGIAQAIRRALEEIEARQESDKASALTVIPRETDPRHTSLAAKRGMP